MSTPIRITSTAEWFRCISPAATLAERHAALAKLVRLLVGDIRAFPSRPRTRDRARKGTAAMLDFLRSGRRPESAREMLEQIAARYPDREKCLRIFVAAVLDDPRYIRAAIECAFDTWSSRASRTVND
jgi:hypothetical protein